MRRRRLFALSVALVALVASSVRATEDTSVPDVRRWEYVVLLRTKGDVRDAVGRAERAAFAEGAARVLQRRVELSPPERNEQRWLPGWMNRVDTYRTR